MRKNSQVHLYLETELLDKLKQEAESLGITLSVLMRQKLNNPSQQTKMEIMIEEISKKLNNQLNFNGR